LAEQFGAVRHEVAEQTGSIRQELARETGSIRQELASQIGETRTELMRAIKCLTFLDERVSGRVPRRCPRAVRHLDRQALRGQRVD
jgi:hypothetical protein